MQTPTDAIQVSLDLSFVRVSMELWRQATDMKVPVHDDFKLHFMQNRGKILHNFANTATAWSIMLRGMQAATPEDATALEAARAEIDEFGGWAKAEMAKLEHLAMEESINASIDEAFGNPDIQRLIRDIWPQPPEGNG